MKKIKFMDLDLFVSKDVFTPSPETNLLVKTTLYALRSMGLEKEPSQILDIGTGSGNVAVSLTKFNKYCKLITLDIKKEALEVAKTNARANGVSDRIKFIQSNLLESLPEKFLGGFDIIVSNPPYVARWEIATLSELVQDEPRIAIDGGEDGLNFYREICAKAPRFLKPGGFLIMEIGYNQSHSVRKLLKEESNFTDLEFLRDDAGIDRVVMARRTTPEVRLSSQILYTSGVAAG